MTTSASAMAKKKLLERRATIARQRTDNASDSVGLLAERNVDEHAVGEEIADVLSRLSDRERTELAELEAALARIEAGTWGQCEKCEEDIGRDRLKVMPEARTCVSCGA